MSDKNKDLKPGDVYVCDIGEHRIVKAVRENSVYSLKAPENRAERQKIEDFELQEMTVRALNIAGQAMDELANHEWFKAAEWFQSRATLAAAILAKMK